MLRNATKGNTIGARMRMNSIRRSRTKTIVLIATLAAVYAILRIIPTFPLVGIPGARFSASDFIATLYGVILGPYSSALSIILGTFVGYFAGRPPIFYGLDFLPATVNGIIVGLIIRGKRGYALLVYLVLLILFVAHPYGPMLDQVNGNSQYGLGLSFVWLHIFGLIILASPVGSRLAGLIAKHSVALATVGFMLMSLIGTLAQHLAGNLLYASLILPLLSTQAQMTSWSIIFWLYPIERIMIVVLSTVIGVPILRTLVSKVQTI